MPLITDPDQLNDGTEIVITPGSKTIQLLVAGNLSTDGVTIKCVYSKLKELWKSNETYIKYTFPMGPITDEQFEMINAWDWADNTTRYLLRTGGWAKKNTTGISEQEWAGIVTLGSLGAADQVYFQQGAATEAGSAAVNFQLTGPVNEGICVYSSGGVPGVFDYRTYLKLFCRTWGKSYEASELDDIGVTTLTYQAYRFPLSNATDIKVTLAASSMSGAPYTDSSITWYAAAQQRDIGGTNRDFHVIIDGAQLTAEEIYQRVHYLLILDSDIDIGAGTQIGKTAPDLLRFVGDTMYTEFYTITPTGGTYIDNFQSADINRLVFVDDTQTERTFPYTAVLAVNFGENLVNDTTAKYWVYFTSIPSGDYGDSDAILVNTAETVGTSARARSSGTTSITAAAAHGLSASDGIEIASVGGSAYNGVHVVVSTPSSVVFTYLSCAGDEAYTADIGGTITENMSELLSSRSSVQLTFEYDSNIQGGRTSGSDAPITAVALGLSGSQFVKTTGTIARTTANSISLVSALERNYQNPT